MNFPRDITIVDLITNGIKRVRRAVGSGSEDKGPDMAKKKAKKKAAKKTTKKAAKKAQKKTAKKKAASKKKPTKKKTAVKKKVKVTKKAKPKKAAAKKKTAKKAAAKKTAAKKSTKKKEAKPVKKKTVKASTTPKTKTRKASTAAKSKATGAPAAAKVTNIAAAKKEPTKAKAAPVSSGGASAAAELKITPKIIEAPEPERMELGHAEDIFSKDELEQFRKMLSTEKQKILDKAHSAMSRGNITIEKDDMYDDVDQASAMIEQNLTFRLLDRDRKLLMEIEHALNKIDNGEFGYCEGTGEPIPKRRLELRPWTRNSVKYQEKLERMRKSGRGVGDEDEM